MDDSMEERFLAQKEEDTTDHDDLKRRLWIESKTIWRIAFPSILSRVTSFGMIIVTQSFIGHISEVELATYALVQSILIRFMYGIVIGMSSATETLCGQAFGAGHHHMMGIYLQRSWIVDGITATILAPLFIFATPILRLLGQEEELAVAAGPIALWFIPMIYSFVMSLTISMFLQAQLKNLIVGWVSTAAFVFHVLLSWMFVNKFNWGVNGAMAAMIISGWTSVVGQVVYVFGGWCPNTWKGFSKAAFCDLLPVVKLSISSGVMICLELWYYSILVLVAGYMKNATIAIDAFSICLNINGWEFMVCLGFLVAASVRVSNELGKGNAKAVKFAIKTILGTSTCIGVVLWILCLVFRNQISYLFSSNEEVAEAVSSLSILFAFSILLNSVQPVLSGIATGAGLQSMVAYVNLGSYYVIGIPIGILLGYVAHLQVKGLWIGLLSGVAMQTFILAWIVWKTDWDEQVRKASERLNRWLLKPPEEDNGSPPHA
ncbi:PREDICTED: protein DETOXIFICATION 24 [Theobroma cacao]|uniref:Protein DETOXIFICATION n=1 Tax=Theobroma cacao TaxID=3641 RepID=A0AB32WEH9_THECC|nr:PREDICTED: protein DETOXIFICATION 24 [Theobroma cacao]XP_017976261.1 PREDICTED: protein DETOXIFICATION 24 [Theobroma cacao]